MKGSYKDKYYQKINSHYNFEINQDRFQKVQVFTRNLMFRHLRNAFVVGCLTEMLIINTNIYENVIRKTTIHRLESKRKEDQNLRERRLLKELSQ